jgi:DNA-binding CsgD family transcriptional regulator
MTKFVCVSRDTTDVLYVTSLAFECRQVDELRKKVLELLQPIFKADSSNFFLAADEDRLSLNAVVSRGIEEKSLSDFRQHYHKYDPFLKLKSLFIRTVACTTEQVIPYEKLVKTCYYNDFLKPQSIHSQLTLYLHSGTRLLGIVALFRPRNRSVFSASDREKAVLMVPSLTGALERTVAVERDTRNQEIIGSIASEISHKGIVILNERREILYANDTARDIISALGGPRKALGCDESPLPEGLSERFLDYLERQAGHLVFDLFTRETKQRVSVSIRQETFAGKSFHKLLLEPGEDSFCLSRKLAELGLTARQSEVVSLVCSGFSNREISDRLYISHYTVENHLRMIFEKLHVKNRTSLARLVSLLSGPPSSNPAYGS